MAKFEDNISPYISFVEGAAPGSPAATNFRLYYDSADHLLKWKNSAGTVSTIATGASGLPTAHGVRAIRSADLSCGNNTYTLMAYTAEDFDTDAMHDNVTLNSRLVIPTITGVTTGLWWIQCSGYTDATTGRTDVQVRINSAGAVGTGTGIGFDTQAIAGAVITGFSLAFPYVFTAADYVEQFIRTTGGAFSLKFDAGFSPIFSASFLGKVT